MVFMTKPSRTVCCCVAPKWKRRAPSFQTHAACWACQMINGFRSGLPCVSSWSCSGEGRVALEAHLSQSPEDSSNINKVHRLTVSGVQVHPHDTIQIGGQIVPQDLQFRCDALNKTVSTSYLLSLNEMLSLDGERTSSMKQEKEHQNLPCGARERRGGHGWKQYR
jgi:hypothetical protein